MDGSQNLDEQRWRWKRRHFEIEHLGSAVLGGSRLDDSNQRCVGHLRSVWNLGRWHAAILGETNLAGLLLIGEQLPLERNLVFIEATVLIEAERREVEQSLDRLDALGEKLVFSRSE